MSERTRRKQVGKMRREAASTATRSGQKGYVVIRLKDGSFEGNRVTEPDNIHTFATLNDLTKWTASDRRKWDDEQTIH